MTLYFAGEGRISQDDPIAGGIEITDEQYAEALAGMLVGKAVQIKDGVLVVDFPKPPDPDPEPEPTFDGLKAAKLAELDDYRWQREIGGVQFAGMTISTDSNSQQKIAAVYTMAKLDPNYGVPTWEVTPGVFMPLDNATIIMLGELVRQHIQNTFNVKAQLYPQVQALPTIEAVAAFDVAAAWAAIARSEASN
ncbi:hypothetical protein [Devosia sp. DBB001]|nr:hypothetical protein [Devosia sp. DBB001]